MTGRAEAAPLAESISVNLGHSRPISVNLGQSRLVSAHLGRALLLSDDEAGAGDDERT